MTPEAFKNSDLLERYLQGLLPDDLAHEVEDLLLQHPELLAEVKESEDALAGYAAEFSTTPPPALKGKVLGAIAELQQSEQKTKPLQNTGYNWYAIAASVLLFVTVGLSYTLVQKNARIDELSNKLAQTEVRMAENNSRMTTMQQNMDAVVMKGMDMVRLKSTDTSKTMFATVFYDKASHKMMLHQGNLEMRTDSMQYQVWALADGKPYSVGVFDAAPTADSMQVMITDIEPQLFAISIEKKGGSPTPTAERIILISEKI